MLSKTKVFPLLKNTIFCKKTFPCFSVVNPLTVWLLGTVLCIVYASFMWWITNCFLTTIWKFSFNNWMKSREKCSFQLECGFEITTSVSNCWWSIPRTATLDKPFSSKTICQFSILMTMYSHLCNVAELAPIIFNVTKYLDMLKTGLLRLSS